MAEIYEVGDRVILTSKQTTQRVDGVILERFEETWGKSSLVLVGIISVRPKTPFQGVIFHTATFNTNWFTLERG